MLTEYQKFKDQLEELNNYINNTETEVIDGEVHLKIDDANLDGFTELLNKVCDSAIISDTYINEVFDYLNELNVKSEQLEMIVKFLPFFAAIHSYYESTLKKKKTKEVELDDWVYETDSFTKPLDARFGKVIDITEENDIRIVKIKIPITNEIIEWEDANFFVIPETEKHLKKLQEAYTRKF